MVWLKRLARVIAVVLVALFCFCDTVFAVSNPDSIAINSNGVAVFRNVLETGDQLWFMRETVGYSTEPTLDASNYFQLAIYSPAGVFTGYSIPIDYYQESIKSIYLTAAQAATITWGGAYLFRVMGMPGSFILQEGVTMKTQTMSPGNYYEFSEMRGYLLTQAGLLQTDWGITLIDATSGLLNTTGATYFNEAIPGLYNMIPSMFQYSSSYPTINGTVWVDNSSTRYREHRGPTLGAAINSTAAWLGTTSSWFSLWITGFICILIGSVSYPIVKTPGNSLVCSTLGLPVSLYIGILEMNAWLMIFLIIGILFAVIFIQGRIW